MLLILLIFVITFSVFHCVYGNQPPKLIYFLCVLSLITIAGFRYCVGVDYENYRLMYELDNEPSNYLYFIEPSWLIINDIVHELNGTYILWFLVVSAITILLIMYGIQKQSSYIFLSMIFFVGSFLYVESFNAVRQFVAMAIIFSATPILLSEKRYWYILVIAFAMCFHYSAGIAIVFFLLRRKYSFMIKICVLIFSALLGEYLLQKILIPLTENFGEFFSTLLDTSRSYVIDASEHDTAINSGLKKLVYNLLAILVVFMTKKWQDSRIFYANCFVLSIVIYNLFRSFMEYLRLYEYFFMYGIILFPLLVRNISGFSRNSNIEKWSIFMLMFIPIFLFVAKDNISIIYQMKFDLFK